VARNGTTLSEAEPSDPMQVDAIDEAPGAPAWVSAAWDDSGATPVVALAWSGFEERPEITTFRVERSTDGASWTEVVSSAEVVENGDGSWSGTDDTADSAVSYLYRVIATTPGPGATETTAPSEASVPALTSPPSPPVWYAAQWWGSDGIELSWIPVQAGLEWQSERSEDGTSWSSLHTDWQDDTGSIFLDTSAESGTAYQYRIAVRNSQGLTNTMYNTIEVTA
jgi:hypothetical protein